MAGPSSVQTQSPPPPPPPVTNAEKTVHEAMTSGWFNPITNGDVKAAVKALEGLSPQDAARVVKDLSADGTLKTLADQINDSKPLGLGGLSTDEKRDFFNAMAGKLDGASLKALGDSFAANDSTFHGRDDVTMLGQAIATHASAATKVDFVKAQAGSLTDHAQDSNIGNPSVTQYGDADAAAVATVLGSLQGSPRAASDAFHALTPDQTKAVLQAGVGRTEILQTNTSPYGGGRTTISETFDPSSFKAVLQSAAQVNDPKLKAQLFDQAGHVLKAMPESSLLSGMVALGRDKATGTMADGMTALLKSDPGGITAQLAGSKSTLDGQAMATYAKTMMNAGRSQDLGLIMKELQVGGSANANPANYFEHQQTITLPNGQTRPRYDNAEALGYFTGSVQAAAQSITSDQKAQADLVTNVVKSGLTLFDKYKVGGLPGQIAASVAKEWVSMSVNAAVKALQDDPSGIGRALDIAAIPTDPATGQIAVGSDSRSAYNTALDTVLRNAKP